MSTIRYFECGRPGCGKPIPFDLKEASTEGYIILCRECLKQWYTKTTGSGCCSTHVKFASIEKNKPAIIKHKAYHK